jgi:hypothetical protein
MFETGAFQRVHPDTGLDTNNLGPPVGAMPFPQTDVANVLPGEASRARLTMLQQHAEDMRALLGAGHTHDVRIELQRARDREKQLTTPRVSGGFGLDDDDRSVIDVRRTIARCEKNMAWLGTLEADRSARARDAGNLVARCEDFLRHGKPGGTKLVEVAPLDVSEMVKKGETPAAALDRLNYRRRELDADAHRVRSAPYPSGDCRAKAHATIDALAERGRPSVDGLIEHDGALAMPQSEMALPLIAIGKDGTSIIGDARGTVDDALALVVWLHKGALVKAIDKLIDEDSDDSSALTATDRAVKLAEIASDKLMCERHEAALLWHMREQGDAAEFRVDADVLGVLGIALVTV